MNESPRSAFRKVRSRAGLGLLVLGDVVALTSALMLAMWLDDDSLSIAHAARLLFHQDMGSLLVALASFLLMFHLFRLYRYAWRFASLDMVIRVVSANTLGLALFLAIDTLIVGVHLTRAVVALLWILGIVIVGGVRILLRIASLSANYGRRGVLKALPKDTQPKRVVIMGAGPSGVRVLEVLNNECGGYTRIVGFLDDMPNGRGTYIRGVKVLGPVSHLNKLLDEHAVDEVVVAMPDAGGAAIRDYVLACRRRRVAVKVMPALRRILDGKPEALQVADFDVADLLRRPAVQINLDSIGTCLTGARVLVTGAGGSIGSELCRQILQMRPAELVLLGHGENSIHQIQSELIRDHAGQVGVLRTVIASVVDEASIDRTFRTYRPQVVFHAAAHKHVPMMEMNLVEAVRNNVMGTRVVTECCGRHGVERMVLISSDKAVHPSSVMGATKWLCEEVVRGLVPTYQQTTYVTVRFGNVLGSRGSVVPIFHAAIKRGGPVHVTHPEMTRFFMTIPEAVQLVLQAGASGRSGELYVLDMGEPVRILDVAHDMIRLCGFEPDVDIAVEFTGIRPGEKLHESLTNDDETMEKSECEGLCAVRRPRYFAPDEMDEMIIRISRMVADGDTTRMHELLDDIVPGFAVYATLDIPSPVISENESAFVRLSPEPVSQSEQPA